MTAPFYRPRAVAHRYQIGWKHVSARSRLFGFTFIVVTVLNIAVFTLTIQLVY